MAEVVNVTTGEISSTELKSTNIKLSMIEEKDLPGVLKLMEQCRIASPPNITTMGGEALVARDQNNEDMVVGFIWALIGNGDTAYVDYFCVHPDYRVKEHAPKKISLLLLEGIHYILKEHGISRFIGVIPPYKKDLIKLYQQFGLENNGKHFVVRV